MSDRLSYIARVGRLGVSLIGKWFKPRANETVAGADNDSDVAAAIRQSGLFDSDWYLKRYPDVAASGVDPIVHYVLHGASEERDPSPMFKTKFYLRNNNDAALQRTNPLYHYIRHCVRANNERAIESPAKPRVENNSANLAIAFQVAGISGTDLARADLVKHLRARVSMAKVLLHVAQGAEALYHIDLWIEFCRSVDENVLVVARSRPLYDRIVRDRASVNAIYVKGGREVEWLVNNASAASAILYVANSETNIHFLRYKHLRHVFIGHGDSEKAASCGKQFRAYDEVWVAGRAHIDRFRNSGIDFSSLRFKVVGRPQVRDLALTSGAGNAKRFLYLPTWEGYQEEQNYSSVRFSESFIHELVELTNLDAVVKFHPYTGKQNKELLELEGRFRAAHQDDDSGSADVSHRAEDRTGKARASVILVDRSVSATDLMRDCAFLVTDISSVVSDFLVTGRPIFVYIPDTHQTGSASSAMPIQRYCYTYSNPRELLAAVRSVILDGDDSLRGARLAVRDYIVDMQRTRNGQFGTELRQVTEGAGDGENEPGSVPHGGSAGVRHDPPRVVAHRGVADGFPENSLGAFREATMLHGLDGVELDVHMAADGTLAVIHDASLRRTTNGEGWVGDADGEYLAQLHLKDNRGDESAESVPTLEQVLRLLGPSRLEIHIELKNNALGDPYPELPERVIELVRQHGLLDRCVLTSFTPSVLEQIRYLDGSVGLLASVNARTIETLGGIDAALRRFKSIDGCLIALERGALNFIRCHNIYAKELRNFGAWVINGEDDLREAFAIGYSLITTDRAKDAIRVRNEILS